MHFDAFVASPLRPLIVRYQCRVRWEFEPSRSWLLGWSVKSEFWNQAVKVVRARRQCYNFQAWSHSSISSLMVPCVCWTDLANWVILEAKHLSEASQLFANTSFWCVRPLVLTLYVRKHSLFRVVQYGEYTLVLHWPCFYKAGVAGYSTMIFSPATIVTWMESKTEYWQKHWSKLDSTLGRHSTSV